MAVITSKGLARFAAFELDLRAGELRKDGAKQVRLPEQPFRILTMVLERPGQVVSREEIRQTLWPNDTVVEFEHSISAAMNRLRQALGDSADHPRYIETLARRGYRFMVPVEWAEPAYPPAAVGPGLPTAPGQVATATARPTQGSALQSQAVAEGNPHREKSFALPGAGDAGRRGHGGGVQGRGHQAGPQGSTAGYFADTDPAFSPDGQWVLYPEIDHVESHIMLVENFRW